MNWLRAVGAVAGLTAGGAAYEAIAERRDRLRYPAPGKQVRIGPHRLHAVVLGKGSPTVVLEAGAAQWSTHWGRVVDHLARVTRVVAYDRGGLGWSEAGPKPRTLKNLSAELERLLLALDVGPMVLVGHSLGSHVLRTYAHRYPERVTGMVLVDAYEPRFEGRLAKAGIEVINGPAWACHGATALQRIGLLRLWSWVDRQGDDIPVSKRTIETMRALWNQKKIRQAIAAEADSHERWAKELREPLSLPAVPRRIITSRYLDQDNAGNASVYDALWLEQSKSQLEGSEDAQHYIVDDGYHLIPLRRPDAVVEPTAALVRQIRKERADAGH